MNTSNTHKLKLIRSLIKEYKKISLINNSNNTIELLCDDFIKEFEDLDNELSSGMALPEDWQ